MPHRFVIADVFTESAFGGNQLAVVPDGRGLSDRAMQAVAREFNFSETTFVLPPDDPAHACRLRIFTPTAELPFAGHPTVGSAAVLAREGMIPLHDGKASFVFEEKVGPVRMEVEVEGERTFARLHLETAVQVPDARPSLADAAAALTLPVEVVREAWYASVGVPFCYIHITDREAVDRARINTPAWEAGFSGAVSNALYLFSGELAVGSSLHARMFAPDFGIVEDPATGAAAAALAGSLAERVDARDGVFAWDIHQGVVMGRPSRIEASAEKRDGRAVRVMVGGHTVLVAEGTIRVPQTL